MPFADYNSADPDGFDSLGDVAKPDGSQHTTTRLLSEEDAKSADRLIALAELKALTNEPTYGGNVLNYSPAIADLCGNLYFRQSMLQDYRKCPMMFLYRWVIGHEEEDTFFAAVMGTAGHRVIQHMHESRNFAITYVDIMQLFLREFDTACRDSKIPPRLSAKYPTLRAQAQAVCPEYCTMLLGYQRHKDNQTFHATILEQSFVLELKDEFSRTFYFTGTIDQAGYYDDGVFALRDIKFRINDFRPGPTAAKLDLQLTLYGFAVHKGVPSCSECRPKYSDEGELVYAGPCSVCQSLIGTSKWPMLIPQKTVLIWMRDYMPRQKDQYTKYVDDPAGGKEMNPDTGRMRKKQVINDKWIHGYKKGEQAGPGHIVTDRPWAFLQARSADILRLAGMIRDGRFYRNEGEHCEYWCKHREPCLGMLETEVQELDVGRLNEHVATIDPFGE